MKWQYRELYETIIRLLGSRKFLLGTATLFVLESLWIAISFRFPMIYDEGAHFNFIQSYTHTIWPYTTDSPGNMTVQISLFHYFLSFIYRALDFLRANLMTIVIVLRVLNIAMVTVGIFIYAKLLKNAGLRQIYINIGLLLFVLLPITPFVAATINYDNMLFLVVAAYLYMCVRIIKEKKPSLMNLTLLFAIGLFATLVKYVFLPILAVTGLFFLVLHFRRFQFKKAIDASAKDLKKNSFAARATLASFALLLITTVCLFGGNIVRYHSVLPSCFDLHTKQICMQNGPIARNEEAMRTAGERSTMRPDMFIETTWIPQMEVYTMWTGNTISGGAVQTKGPLPVMELFLAVGIVVGIGAVIYTWRFLKRSPAYNFLIAVAVFWVLVILAENMRSYYKVHEAYAIQPRYLLIVLPIFLVAIVYAASDALGRKRRAKVLVFLDVLLILTQGGGVITHIVGSENSWYWPNSPIIQADQTLRNALRPLVKG